MHYTFNNNVNVDLRTGETGSELSSQEFLRWKNVFLNDGVDFATGDKWQIKDILNTSNASPLLPKVVVSLIKEAQEPLLVGASLLDQVQYQPYTTFVMPAIGALSADDIPEGGPYPEHQPNLGGATVTANVGKVGMAFGFTEEMLRYSDFDLMGLYMRQAGRAMARHKESKIFRHILSLGIIAFDNADPTTSLFGVTHGRDITGAANGSMVMDDLFDVLAASMHNGYQPDTILVHPLTWLMWVKDPVMRAFALQNGAGSFFQQWQGQPAQQNPFDNGGRTSVSNGRDIVPGPSGSGAGNAAGAAASPVADYSQVMNSAPSLPSYFPFPFRIVVSPFMPFDPDTLLTDVVVFQSGALGALLVDEELTTDEWTDPRVDVRKIKLRERYGIAIYDEGQGVMVARNVKVTPNQVVLPATATYNVSNGIAAIPAATSVV
jgi:hypothetical protein